MKPSLLLIALVCVEVSWAHFPAGFPGVGSAPMPPPAQGQPRGETWGGTSGMQTLFQSHEKFQNIWEELQGRLTGFGTRIRVIQAFLAQNPWDWNSGTLNAFVDGVFLLPFAPPELRTSARNSLFSNGITKENMDKAIAAFQAIAKVLPVDSVVAGWLNDVVRQLRTSKSVTEIVVQTLKQGYTLQDYKQKRDAAFADLAKSPGFDVIRSFHSYSAVPVPDTRDVFFGMLRWDSKKSVDERNSIALSKPTPEFLAFMAIFDPKAYAQVRQIEGPYFDLATVAKGREVLILAIRQVNQTDEARFQLFRRRYENLLASQDGVVQICEFQVVSDSLLPTNADPNPKNLKVGIVVAQSKRKWQSAVTALSRDPVTKAYFATFTPVAYQYAEPE